MTARVLVIGGSTPDERHHPQPGHTCVLVELPDNDAAGLHEGGDCLLMPATPAEAADWAGFDWTELSGADLGRFVGSLLRDRGSYRLALNCVREALGLPALDSEACSFEDRAATFEAAREAARNGNRLTVALSRVIEQMATIDRLRKEADEDARLRDELRLTIRQLEAEVDAP